MDTEKLPREVSSADFEIPGFGTIRVSVLDNGQRVISGAGAEALLREMLGALGEEEARRG